jgi:hypothetical protein
MKQTLRTRWFNWHWRPANIWGRYRLRHLPTTVPDPGRDWCGACLCGDHHQCWQDGCLCAHEPITTIMETGPGDGTQPTAEGKPPVPRPITPTTSTEESE